MWIQRTTTTGKATPMNTCGSTCWQNKHVDPSERFLEKNRYNTTSQRLPQKTWNIQISCSSLQNPGKLWWRRCLVAFDWVRGEQPCWRVIMLCYSLQNSWRCKIKQSLENCECLSKKEGSMTHLYWRQWRPHEAVNSCLLLDGKGSRAYLVFLTLAFINLKRSPSEEKPNSWYREKYILSGRSNIQLTVHCHVNCHTATSNTIFYTRVSAF